MYDSLHASGGGLAVLHVVQTAAWDWAPPHMSGYPHLPAPPRSTSTRTTKTRSGPAIRHSRGAPLRCRRMASRRGATRLPCPMARRRGATPFPAVWRAAAGSPASPTLWRAPRGIGRAAGASSEGATRPIHRCGREPEGAWAAAEPTRSYVLRCGFQCVVCTEP